MIGSIINGISRIAGKVTGAIKHKNEVKLKTQEMQYNYLKEKVSIGLFTFVAITVVLPYFFYSLSPILKNIPFMVDILNDYEKILNTITIDRIFKVVFTLLGLGGFSAGAMAIGKIKMAAKKEDHKTDIEKEKIKRGVLGDDFVNIETKSKLKKVQEFVNNFADMAENIEKKYNLPADGVLAHAALETGWGRHILTGIDIDTTKELYTNSIFNIKKSKSWKGKSVIKKRVWEDHNSNGKIDPDEFEKAIFRAYDSPMDSFEDYAKLITTKEKFKKVTTAKNAEEYGQYLFDCGYQTDAGAPKTIAKIAKMFDYET